MAANYWAKRRNQITGPHESVDAALAAFRTQFPFTGPDYQAKAKRNQIMTGYGTEGPYFDLHWHDACAVSRSDAAEARRIAVSKDEHATVTYDAMAVRLKAINDPLWLLCAARAAMQRASGIIGPIALPDGPLAGALTDALEALHDWRK